MHVRRVQPHAAWRSDCTRIHRAHLDHHHGLLLARREAYRRQYYRRDPRLPWRGPHRQGQHEPHGGGGRRPGRDPRRHPCTPRIGQPRHLYGRHARHRRSPACRCLQRLVRLQPHPHVRAYDGYLWQRAHPRSVAVVMGGHVHGRVRVLPRADAPHPRASAPGGGPSQHPRDARDLLLLHLAGDPPQYRCARPFHRGRGDHHF
mmetsp:Transcript_21527/g.57894  ORF Transcript_21527/g.57894 Transcript_21527/m.57894 type:complete len:203 (-) Transcript_21527:407-1015(-)